MKKFTRIAILSLMLSIALTVFGAVAVTAQEEESTLVIGWEQEPPNLWPLNTLTFGGLLESMYARDLWEFDVDRNPYPVMVTELPSIDNGRVVTTEDGDTAVTVTLREGLLWSDGTPITAADCEVWHTIRTDTSTSTNVSRDAYPDLAQSFEIDEEDPLTFTITYNGTYPDYIGGSERPECRYPGHVFGPMIEDGGILEDSDYFTGGGVEGLEGAVSVGYGPYMVESWDIGSSITFVKNPNWDGEEAAWDRIVAPFITDSTQMQNALEVGEIDMAFGWSDNLQPDYEAIEDVETFAVPGVYTDALWIRSGEIGNSPETGGDALQDPLVRQAIAHAIDRRLLAEELVGPGITVPTSWYPEALWPDDLPFLEYDPDLAGELLDEAGWVLNDDGIREKDGVTLDNLRLVTTENELRNNYQVFIQDFLAQVGIGVDIQIIPATRLFATYSDQGTLTNYEWDLAIFANSANALTPTSFDDYKCDGIPSDDNPDGFNPWQFCNPRYDEVDALISTTLPGAERDELTAEAVRLHFEGYFWHGLRLRSTWFAVNTSVMDRASVELFAGSLESNWFNQIENWDQAS
jgi:peptide/nickel transport system substrate-binding protein